MVSLGECLVGSWNFRMGIINGLYAEGWKQMAMVVHQLSLGSLKAPYSALFFHLYVNDLHGQVHCPSKLFAADAKLLLLLLLLLFFVFWCFFFVQHIL